MSGGTTGAAHDTLLRQHGTRDIDLAVRANQGAVSRPSVVHGQPVRDDDRVGDATFLTATDDSAADIDDTEVSDRGRCPACVAPLSGSPDRDARTPSTTRPDHHASATPPTPEQPADQQEASRKDPRV